MIYAVLFACALILGWIAAFRMGGTAERETMCLLTCVWLGTIAVNWMTRDPAPYASYALLDFLAVIWLWWHQRRNWQWLTAGIFATMLLAHVVFLMGTSSGEMIYSGRPYQDILAGLGYLQIIGVGIASYERGRARAGRVSRLGNRLLASDLLFHRRMDNGNHASQR